MMFVEVHNTTPGGRLTRKDGTADYDVQVLINRRTIWRGYIEKYYRDNGAAQLLRVIADKMDKTP